MKIQVLGSGCAKCKTLHQAVQEVAQKLNISDVVEYSTDIAEITKLGAMSSPVFAIDGKIITAGKVPTTEEIENALKSNSFGEEKGDRAKKTSCCGEKESPKKETGCCSGGSCETEKKSKCCIFNALKKIFSRLFKK